MAGPRASLVSTKVSWVSVALFASAGRRCFTRRANFYGAQKAQETDIYTAVIVQAMVFGDKSRAMFTMDLVSRTHGRIVIEAIFGLAERLVSRRITPDSCVLNRDDAVMVQRSVSRQPAAVVYVPGSRETKQIGPDDTNASRAMFDSENLQSLRELGLRLEAFFGRPQDIEWSVRAKELVILQGRPITDVW